MHYDEVYSHSFSGLSDENTASVFVDQFEQDFIDLVGYVNSADYEIMKSIQQTPSGWRASFTATYKGQDG